jgi:hypothetical protein
MRPSRVLLLAGGVGAALFLLVGAWLFALSGHWRLLAAGGATALFWVASLWQQHRYRRRQAGIADRAPSRDSLRIDLGARPAAEEDAGDGRA